MSINNPYQAVGTPSLIGQVVRALRIARGVGVNQLGNAVGLEPANLSRFERGLPGGVHATKYLDLIAMRLDTHASILYAIAEVASNNLDILRHPKELSDLVERLTFLIKNYLVLPTTVQEEINRIIKDNQ